jgi:hypothetical protein
MAKAKTDTVTLMAGGDVGPVLKPVDRLADLIAPVFQQANIRFAQCERTYSKRDWTAAIRQYRKFKHPFSLTGAISPDRRVVKRTSVG